MVGETSNVRNAQNALVQSHVVVNFITRPSPEEKGHTENEYINATQLDDHVPETQIHEAHKAQITNFLMDSWANMEDQGKEDDNGVDLLQEKDFKLVTSKTRKGGKTLTIANTRLVSSQPNLLQ